MRRRAFLLVATWPFACIDGHAQPPFDYRELEACSRAGNPYATDGLLQARRVAHGQVLLATVPLNCWPHIKVTVEDGTPIYVNIENVFEEGVIAKCDCMRRFEITLKWTVPAGTTIWLLGNGRGAARTIAK